MNCILLIASRELQDGEELLLDYRLEEAAAAAAGLQWYHPFDPLSCEEISRDDLIEIPQ